MEEIKSFRYDFNLRTLYFTSRKEIWVIHHSFSWFSAELEFEFEFVNLLKAETPPIATSRSDVLLSSTSPFLWEESVHFQWAEGDGMLFTFLSSSL